jgi:hypothetical protein
MVLKMLPEPHGMSYNSTSPIRTSLVKAHLDLTGLSEAQKETCCSTLETFLERNHLASWRLNVNLKDDGPERWLLDIDVVASAEFDFQVRSTQVSVDKTLDLAQVVDLCLETHYNACMNGKAMSYGNAALLNRAASRY